MNNEYQLGKDIGDILSRLERLENDDCHCNEEVAEVEEGFEGFFNTEEQDLLFSYSVHPMLQNKVHISIILNKEDELVDFFKEKEHEKVATFIEENSNDFLFYSTVLSIEKVEELEDSIEVFFNSIDSLSSRKYKHKCIYYRKRYIGGCGGKKVSRYCETRAKGWKKCKNKGHSLCPHIHRRYKQRC